MSRNQYALEAAISRSYKTLDLMFPGIELDLAPDEPRMSHIVVVKYTHPRLGRLRWHVAVHAWATELDNGYVEHLIRDIPHGFAQALLEAAEVHTSANRYSWGGKV